MAEVFQIEKIERSVDPMRSDDGRSFKEYSLTMTYVDDPAAGKTTETVYIEADKPLSIGDKIMLQPCRFVLWNINAGKEVDFPRQIFILTTPLEVLMARKL